MLVTHRPSAALAPYVESIWFAARAAAPHQRERLLPTGRVDIVIPLRQHSVLRFDDIDAATATHYRGGAVSGAHDRFVVRGLGGASAVLGVHFKPGGAAPFLAAAELHNRTVPLDAVWGPRAGELRERLLGAGSIARQFQLVEELLIACLPAAKPADAMVQQALRALAHDPSVARIAELQRASGCSPQRFIRRFEAAAGIAPKRLARVLRFNALLPKIVRVGPRDWAALAAEGGYYDQSHLIHEFNRLAGITPGAYHPVQPTQPTHVPVPAAAGGKISNTRRAR